MDGKPDDPQSPKAPSDQVGQSGGPQPAPSSPQPIPAPSPVNSQPTTPAARPNKESEPVATSGGGEAGSLQEDKIAKEGNDEYWLKFSAEIKAEKEAIEAGGIEKIEMGEAPIPPKLAQEMGVQPTPTATEPHQGDFMVRGVGLSDDQLSGGMKKPMQMSVRWFVEWFIYQLLKAHFLVRKVHGKIVRQKRSG